MTHLKRTTQAVCASALIALIAGCSDNSSVPVAISDSSAGAKSAQEDSGLPQNIIDAVNEAKPGGTIVAATIEKEDGKTVYEVKVEADGQLWEVEVSAKGKVLKIELDDGDGDGEGNEGADSDTDEGNEDADDDDDGQEGDDDDGGEGNDDDDDDGEGKEDADGDADGDTSAG